MVQEIKFPEKILLPIKKFLESEIIRWKRTEKKIKAGDPFKDSQRSGDNSLEEDVDEQIGHEETTVKAGFARRQVVQIRKALTRIKVGKYGLCEKCGKMIDTERLAIRPEATTCVRCAKERE